MRHGLGLFVFQGAPPNPQRAPLPFSLFIRHDDRQAPATLNWTEGDVEAAHAAQVEVEISQVTNGNRGFFNR